MARATAKAAPTRSRKATPANRGHGEKGTAKYDETKHPRGPSGRFASKGGATSKAAKTPGTPTPPKKAGTAKQRKGLADQIRKARAAAKTPAARKALLTQVRGLRQKRADWKRGQGKTRVEKLPKSSRATKPPKPPRKVGTAKQRKGLADQIRAARAGAKTPEARKALLGQVRALRASRSEWQRGQGKKQVESLPKPPKPPKEAKPKKEPKPRVVKEKAPKEPKPPKEPKAPKKATKKATEEDPIMRRAKALQARYGRAGAKDIGEMSRLAGERHAAARDFREQRRASARVGRRLDAVTAAAARKGDLQARAELSLRKSPAEMHGELVAHIEEHRSPASGVKTHGMAESEAMHSVQFGRHVIHFPKGSQGAEAAARTARNLTVGDQIHPELARHTKNIYLTAQRNRHDSHWEQKYQMEHFVAAATGGDGDVVAYNGNPLGASTFAHEAGHNLATTRYGNTMPRAGGDFMAAAAKEKYPTDYAKKSPAEDFADSVRLYTIDNARLKSANPLRYRVIDRMLQERGYGG